MPSPTLSRHPMPAEFVHPKFAVRCKLHVRPQTLQCPQLSGAILVLLPCSAMLKHCLRSLPRASTVPPSPAFNAIISLSRVCVAFMAWLHAMLCFCALSGWSFPTLPPTSQFLVSPQTGGSQNDWYFLLGWRCVHGQKHVCHDSCKRFWKSFGSPTSTIMCSRCSQT